MTSPAVSDLAPSAGRRPSRWRWLESVIALLLVGAVGAVALSASPALLRAAGLTRTATTVRVGLMHPDRHSLPGTSDRALDGKRGFVFNFDDEDRSTAEPDEDGPGSPPRRRTDPHGVRSEDSAAAGTDKPSQAVKMGFSRTALKLFDQPAANALVTATVKAGELVFIVKEQGEWALVVHSPEMGWARLSEIAVR